MEALQQELQRAIQKFQAQGRQIVQTEFQQEVADLKQKLVSKNKRLEFLEQENTKLKKGYERLNEKLGDLITDIISQSTPAILSETDEKGAPLLLETKESGLHSIKDRIKYMNHDPQTFSKQLSTIGKKMADYYRKAHNGEEPSKRDEKINEKHTSPVCVYPKPDWEHMDYLIKTSLDIQ